MFGARRPVRQHRARQLQSSSPTSSASAPATTSVTEAGFGADMGAERVLQYRSAASSGAWSPTPPWWSPIGAGAEVLTRGKYKVVAGRPLPEEMLRENPDDVAAGAANLRLAAGEHPRVTASSRSSPSTPCRRTTSPSATPSPRLPRRWACACASSLTHFADGVDARRHRAGRGRGRGGVPGRAAWPLPLPQSEATLREKIETVGDQDLRSSVQGDVDYTPLSGFSAARRLREERLRPPAGLHRQDPVQPVARLASLVGAPSGFRLPGRREVRASVERGLRLPDLRRHADHADGLSRSPGRDRHSDLDENGNIVGLY